MLNTVMVLKVLNGDVSSDYIISKIKINVPFRPTRYYQFLHIDFQRTRYASVEPIRRMCIDFNSLYHIIDFGVGIDTIKSRIISYLDI